MGQEFQDAIGTDEWDVLHYVHFKGYKVDKLGLFHCHPASDDPQRNSFWVNDEDRCCRICGKQAPDFVWFRYKTWNLRFLTQ